MAATSASFLSDRISVLYQEYLGAVYDLQNSDEVASQLGAAANQAYTLIDSINLKNLTMEECTETVNNALNIIILLDKLYCSSPDGPLLQQLSLNAWKRFIKFLKLFHSYISVELMKVIVLIFDRYINIGLLLITDPASLDLLLDTVDTRSLQNTLNHINFFTQKMSASLAYFLDQLPQHVGIKAFSSLLCVQGVINAYGMKSGELKELTCNSAAKSLDYLQKALIIQTPSEECPIIQYRQIFLSQEKSGRYSHHRFIGHSAAQLVKAYNQPGSTEEGESEGERGNHLSLFVALGITSISLFESETFVSKLGTGGEASILSSLISCLDAFVFSVVFISHVHCGAVSDGVVMASMSRCVRLVNKLAVCASAAYYRFVLVSVL